MRTRRSPLTPTSPHCGAATDASPSRRPSSLWRGTSPILSSTTGPATSWTPRSSAISTWRWSSACCSSSRPSSSPTSTRGTPTALWTRSPPSCATSSRTGPAGERADAGSVGHEQPGADHRALPVRGGHHALHHLLGFPAEQDGRRLLRGRPLVLRLPERSGHRRRLHVCRVLPRHLGLHRALRLRRLPLLDRLPRRLARGAAAGRRAPAQLGALHDGRPAGLPDAPVAGAQRGGHLDDRRVDLLPARPDG